MCVHLATTFSFSVHCLLAVSSAFCVDAAAATEAAAVAAVSWGWWWLVTHPFITSSSELSHCVPLCRIQSPPAHIYLWGARHLCNCSPHGYIIAIVTVMITVAITDRFDRYHVPSWWSHLSSASVYTGHCPARGACTVGHPYICLECISRQSVASATHHTRTFLYLSQVTSRIKTTCFSPFVFFVASSIASDKQVVSFWSSCLFSVHDRPHLPPLMYCIHLISYRYPEPCHRRLRKQQKTSIYPPADRHLCRNNHMNVSYPVALYSVIVHFHPVVQHSAETNVVHFV